MTNHVACNKEQSLRVHLKRLLNPRAIYHRHLVNQAHGGHRVLILPRPALDGLALGLVKGLDADELMDRRVFNRVRTCILNTQGMLRHNIQNVIESQISQY